MKIMEESHIFGPDVALPSLPGLQSDCEEELHLLMKEVDLEFQRKHNALLTELINVRSLCRAQRDEIENLRGLLESNNETVQKDNFKEQVKEYSKEIEKLKEENNELRNENVILQRRVRRLPENELQLDSLKRSLCIQQDENKVLMVRLSKIDEQYQTLQNSYQKVVNTLASFNQDNENQQRTKVDNLSLPNRMQAEIVQTTQKFLSEEKESCNDFLSKINREIDNLETKLRKEVS